MLYKQIMSSSIAKIIGHFIYKCRNKTKILLEKNPKNTIYNHL